MRLETLEPRRAGAMGLVLALAVFVASGCAAWHAPMQVEDHPRQGPMRALAHDRPALALVLSGGSARGFAHLGVIKVLEEAGIEPDLIVGTSAGSLVGVLYASGMDTSQMVAAAKKFDSALMRDFTIPNLGQPMLRGELGFIRGERLQVFVDELVSGRPLQALPHRLAVVATDLQTGQPAVFTHGDAGLAVRASSAVPGVFVPPRIDGRLYVDGQVSSPLPVTVARMLGADIVIAVDATFPPDYTDIATTLSVIFQSFTIATQRIKDYELGQATVVIRPDIRSPGQLALSDRDWIMAAGEKAAREMLPTISRLIGRAERVEPASVVDP